ncbi:MAG: GntR family transcriptional regulator [Hyphomicrobiales bacterium]|nr:GntR family transcriptional regulator [Hyphomicrobiales bacterium]
MTPTDVAGASPPPSLRLGLATYERLRDMILCGELAAGARLQEKRLADQLGVSRTPVREAITRLAADGLVTREAGLTPLVRRLRVDDFIEILHVRRLLEVDAAGRAAAAPRDLRLMALRARFVAFGEGPPPDPAAHMAADDELHNRLAHLAGSHLLAELIADLRRKTRIFDAGRVPERLRPGAREHIAIIDAVLDGDADAAREAMRSHIDNVRASVLRHLERLA